MFKKLKAVRIYKCLCNFYLLFFSNFSIDFLFYYQKYIKINTNTNITLSVYIGVILWCITLTEEHKLSVSENRLLREILVGERNWETVDCRRVHSGELHGEWC